MSILFTVEMTFILVTASYFVRADGAGTALKKTAGAFVFVASRNAGILHCG